MAGITLKTGRRKLSVPRSVIRRAVEEAYSTPLTEEELNAPPVNVIITKRMPTPKKTAVRKTTPKKRTVKKS
jgi:hypothetical protein